MTLQKVDSIASPMMELVMTDFQRAIIIDRFEDKNIDDKFVRELYAMYEFYSKYADKIEVDPTFLKRHRIG